MYSDDPVSDFGRYEEEMERRDADLPTCDICGKKIYDEHYYFLYGMKYCAKCLDDEFKTDTY